MQGLSGLADFFFVPAHAASTTHPFRLGAEESTSFDRLKVVDLFCVEGDVWLTCDGFGGEMRLKGGHYVRLDDCYNVIVTALSASSLEFR
jgi:hypothetical protein